MNINEPRLFRITSKHNHEILDRACRIISVVNVQYGVSRPLSEAMYVASTSTWGDDVAAAACLSDIDLTLQIPAWVMPQVIKSCWGLSQAFRGINSVTDGDTSHDQQVRLTINSIRYNGMLENRIKDGNPVVLDISDNITTCVIMSRDKQYNIKKVLLETPRSCTNCLMFGTTVIHFSTRLTLAEFLHAN